MVVWWGAAMATISHIVHCDYNQEKRVKPARCDQWGPFRTHQPGKGLQPTPGLAKTVPKTKHVLSAGGTGAASTHALASA